MKQIPFYTINSQICVYHQNKSGESHHAQIQLSGLTHLHTYESFTDISGVLHGMERSAHMDCLPRETLLLITLSSKIDVWCVLHTLTYQTHSTNRCIYKIWIALNVETASASVFPCLSSPPSLPLPLLPLPLSLPPPLSSPIISSHFIIILKCQWLS